MGTSEERRYINKPIALTCSHNMHTGEREYDSARAVGHRGMRLWHHYKLYFSHKGGK